MAIPRSIVLYTLSFLAFLLIMEVIRESMHSKDDKPFPVVGRENNTSTIGSWELLVENAGVSAMHMALLHTNKVIIFDRTEVGPSKISLPDGKCPMEDPNNNVDCTAHSIEYDIATNKVRPLMIQTDAWCSSGAFASDGRLVQTGGYHDGERVVREFKPCSGNQEENCDWEEFPVDGDGNMVLTAKRWYATDHILPDGRIIVIGGRKQFNYEFLPKKNSSDTVWSLPFLLQTTDSAENNLYPFVNLMPNGNLFVFANTKSILLDYNANRVVRQYPEIPGGDARNYPSSGGSVLLPLDARNGFQDAEVLICGGAQPNSYGHATDGNFSTASNTCGRMKITDKDPQWEMETMPGPRIMGDMLLLPTGDDVLIINGAQRGSAGWGNAREPAFQPFLYKISEKKSHRFSTMAGSSIPRMYHSSCHVLPDGRVLIGGSNTNVRYEFENVLFPTELRLEAFSPPYLGPSNRPYRPAITWFDHSLIAYSTSFDLHFWVEEFMGSDEVSVTLLAPYFTTHGYSQNQRLLKLMVTEVVPQYVNLGGRRRGHQHRLRPGHSATVIAPPSKTVAPPGYYLLFVVHAGIPSPGEWIQLT